jgi:hypothetical protein
MFAIYKQTTRTEKIGTHKPEVGTSHFLAEYMDRFSNILKTARVSMETIYVINL